MNPSLKKVELRPKIVHGPRIAFPGGLKFGSFRKLRSSPGKAKEAGEQPTIGGFMYI
jgi:hypothetical protein